MSTLKQGMAIAAVMTLLAACGSQSDGASDPNQPGSVPSNSRSRVISEPDVMRFLGVDEDGNVVPPSTPVCEIKAILTTAKDVRKSLEAGNTVSITPDGTTGVVVMGQHRVHREYCAQFIELILSTFPHGHPYVPPVEEQS